MNFALLIAIRLWKQLLRDRRTLALVLFAPIFYVVMFGMVFGGEIEGLPIIVINKDSDVIGEKVVESLQNSSKVIVWESDDFGSAQKLVDNKKYVAAIFIPENFTYNFLSGEKPIELYLDNSNPQVGIAAMQALQEAFQDATSDFNENFGFDVSYAYGEGLSTMEFFAPAIIGLGVFFLSFLLILMNLIEERKKGTLHLLLQCPHDKGHIIIGYLMAFSVFSMIQTTFIIVITSTFYQVSFGTNIFHYISLYFTAVLLGWTSLMLGIFCSSFARSEFQAVQFIPLVLFPAIFLSGIIIPLIQIPEIFRWLSFLFPLTYGISLLQQISIEEYVLELTNMDLLVLVFFFLLFLLGSRLSLKET